MKVWQKKRVTFTIATFLSACLALPLPPEDVLDHDSASALISKQGKVDAESEDYIAEGFYSPANQTDPGNFLVIIQTWSDYLSGEPEGANNETTPQNTSEELPSRKQRSLKSTSEDYEDSDIYPEEGYEATLASDRVDEESKHFSISESNKYYIDQEEDYPQTHENVEEKRGEELQEEPHETSEGEELTEESHESSEEEYNERRKRNVKNQESSALNTGISPNANGNSSSINQRLDSSTAERITKMSEYKENAATTPESTNTASEDENHDAAKSENKETTKMFLYKRSLDKNESKEDLSTKSTYEKHEATSKDNKTESYIKETSRSDSKGSIDTEPKDVLTTTSFENKNKSSEENRTESVKEETRSEKLISKRSTDEDVSKEDDTTEKTSEETEGTIMYTTTEVYNKETMKNISEFKRSIMNDESEKSVPTTISSGNMDEAVRDMTTEAYSKESTGKFMYKQSIDKDNSKNKDGNKMDATTEVYNKETKPEKFVYKRNLDENYSKEDDTTTNASEITDKSEVETTTEVYNKLTMKSVSEFKRSIMNDESEKNVSTTIPYKNMDVTVMDITTETYNKEATTEKFVYKRSIDEYHAKEDYTTTTASGVIDGTRMYTTAENLNKETMKSTLESKKNIVNDETKAKTKL